MRAVWLEGCQWLKCVERWCEVVQGHTDWTNQVKLVLVRPGLNVWTARLPEILKCSWCICGFLKLMSTCQVPIIKVLFVLLQNNPI